MRKLFFLLFLLPAVALAGLKVDSAGGGASVGSPVSGGTANEVLYNDSSGNLANSATLGFDGTTFTAGAATFSGAISHTNGSFTGSSAGNGYIMSFTGNGASQGTSFALAHSGGSGANFVPSISINHSRASSANLALNDGVGIFSFSGMNSSAYRPAAQISAEVDATVGASILPGRMRFYTTNTSGTSTERIRIDSAGNVGIGSVLPGFLLNVSSGPVAFDGTMAHLMVGPSQGASGIIDINASSTTVNMIHLTNTSTGLTSGDGTALQLDGSSFYITNYEASSMSFGHGTPEINIRNVNGYVGINDASPDADLEALAQSGEAPTQPILAVSSQSDVLGSLFAVLNNGNVGIGNAAPTSKFVVTQTSSETITAAATITADACGTLKKITAAGAVTTGTTNTFTAPSAGLEGCIMTVVNVGSNNITLDNNALFKSAGGADVVMTADDVVQVGCTGSVWYQLTALEAN